MTLGRLMEIVKELRSVNISKLPAAQAHIDEAIGHLNGAIQIIFEFNQKPKEDKHEPVRR